ncbi:MAG TPA: hypothetical protein VLM36_04030 [Sphingomicrobium sp.]|nr:hypothetical protein [Sphingomicrobium sp.]
MWTKHVVLRIGKADGSVLEIPMRYNASHQRGFRCFIGALAETPEEIREDTPPSFEGRRLFDALGEYRKSIEPMGWRLLHAAARRDCWPRPNELDPSVEKLTRGIEGTERIDAFEHAEFGEVATLIEQQSSFEDWMRSLAPVYAPRATRKSGHERDEPVVEFSALARFAGEYLAAEQPDLERAIAKARGPSRSKPK